MRVGAGIDQLTVDADLIGRPADASLERVAYPQLMPDLFRTDDFVLVGERSVV
jgi:hypothetical protein